MKRAGFGLAGSLIAVGILWWTHRPPEEIQPAPVWHAPEIPLQALPSRAGAMPLPIERPAASGVARFSGPGAFSAPGPELHDAGPLSAAAGLARPNDAVAVLEDVLRRGNDNDPRLDHAFNTLSVEDRQRFREKYDRLQRLAPERRNELGTIVFLLGKNLHDADDWAFMRRIVMEPPCLSMENCAHAPSTKVDDDGNVAITLVYPQLVALAQAKKALAFGKGNGEALAVLRAAQSSASPIVSNKASDILYGR